MKDVDGNDVDVGDTVKVLAIDPDVLRGLSEDEEVHHLAMIGNNYVIEAIVENGRKASVSIEWECEEGIAIGGLYMLSHEFRLVEKMF